MTTEQAELLLDLSEQLERRLQQERAVRERLNAATDVMVYVKNCRALLEENIARTLKGLPLKEDELERQMDITEWLN